jgi:hypothetical protein
MKALPGIAISMCLAGCAIVSYDIDPTISACRTADDQFDLSVINIQTVRGSIHTPFDYGNKSVNNSQFIVRIPRIAGSWSGEEIQVFSGTTPIDQRRGRVTVSDSSVEFDLQVAFNTGPGIRGFPYEVP